MGKPGFMQDFFNSLDAIEKEMRGLCGCFHKPPPCPPGCKPERSEERLKPPCPPGCRPEKPHDKPKPPCPPGCVPERPCDCRPPNRPPCGRERFCCEEFWDRKEKR